ncbi:MAG: hypothetical protein ACYTGC_06665, partial [Planctomycetota bacterium]
ELGLGLGVILLVAPLLTGLLELKRIGQARPLIYPVGPKVRQAVTELVAEQPGVQAIMMGRSAIDPEWGIGIYLSCERPLPVEFKTELTKAVEVARGEVTPVRIFALKAADVVGPRP